MNNRLEQFIRSNRDAFDSDEPGKQVWEKVQGRLKPGASKAKLVSMQRLRWLAAAAIVLMLGAATFLYLNKRTTSPEVATTNPTTDTNQNAATDIIGEINPAYAKEVYHFTQLIELKQSELKKIAKEEPELYRKFISDINKLDSSYTSLKNELPANPNREQLLEAMIENLQLQTDLLNQQLQIIQQIRKSKNKNNESNNKSI